MIKYSNSSAPRMSKPTCSRFIRRGSMLLLLGLSATVSADAALDQRIEQGRAIAADRNAGNCYSCHVVEGVELPGNSGPPLIEMSVRYPDRVDLKAQIADARVRNPETPMPPYGAHHILTDSELESLVDYIQSL